MPLEINGLATARFGAVSAHLIDTTAKIDIIDDSADQLGVELLTARIDVSDLPTTHRFEAAGFRLMDTLVYYGRSASGPAAPSIPSGTSIRLADHADVDAVGAIARRAFRDYFGHFHSDPRLDRDAADAAYVEWAETSTVNVDEERPVLLSCDEDGAVLGFLTLRNVGDPTAEIVLNAVDPDQQGRGIYASLIEAALCHVGAAGTERLIVSTQINNYGVQRVWARLGFVHERSVYTFHKWYERDPS